MNKDKLAKAKIIAHRLLKFRPRSEKELQKRLKLNKIPEETVKKVIADFKRVSLIDDKQFAGLWIQDRLKKGYGFLRIKKELKEKGINEELIKESMGKLNKETSYVSLIDALVRRRIKRYSKASLPEIKRKLFYYLLGRGFASEEINASLKELDAP